MDIACSEVELGYGFLCSGHTGLFLVPFTTSVELVGTKMVTFWSNMSHVPFALGQFLVIMIAYGERDWRTFQGSQNAMATRGVTEPHLSF